jgi:hypothetical protein
MRRIKKELENLWHQFWAIREENNLLKLQLWELQIQLAGKKAELTHLKAGEPALRPEDVSDLLKATTKENSDE